MSFFIGINYARNCIACKNLQCLRRSCLYLAGGSCKLGGTLLRGRTLNGNRRFTLLPSWRHGPLRPDGNCRTNPEFAHPTPSSPSERRDQLLANVDAMAKCRRAGSFPMSKFSSNDLRAISRYLIRQAVVRHNDLNIDGPSSKGRRKRFAFVRIAQLDTA